MDILSKVPERLQELMFYKGVNGVQLATQLDVSESVISKYLNGKQAPRYDLLIKLVEFFNCSADFLLGQSETIRYDGQLFKPVPPFPQQFRLALKKCHLSQYALQKRSGISWGSIVSWLNGDYLPASDSLIKIAKTLDCSVDFLLGRED